MKNKIYITNDQDKVEVTQSLRGLIRRAIGQALKYEKFPYDAEVSVTLVDNAEIKELNAEYRNIDRATDVLSFPMYEGGEIDESEVLEGEPVSIGDIVLSLERATEQAQEFGHSFERETAFLCVHSVLHLLGYDHELGEEEEKDMFARQEAVLAEMKLTRS